MEENQRNCNQCIKGFPPASHTKAVIPFGHIFFFLQVFETGNRNTLQHTTTMPPKKSIQKVSKKVAHKGPKKVTKSKKNNNDQASKKTKDQKVIIRRKKKEVFCCVRSADR